LGYLTTEHLKFGDEDQEHRLLTACINLLQPYAHDPKTLESIATLAARRHTAVQMRTVVPGLLVTGFVTFAVVNVVPPTLFAILLLLTVGATFSLLLELGRAQAAGIIQDAIEILRYQQDRSLQRNSNRPEQLLEALILSTSDHHAERHTTILIRPPQSRRKQPR
jgi:hypothetical protein